MTLISTNTPHTTSPLRCLIIDDEPLAVERLELFIGKLAHKIICVGVCYSPREAWQIVQQQDIDLLLMDINFSAPDPHNQEGFDFVVFTKNNPRVPPVIFITGHHPELAIEAWDLEVVDFLSKPVYPDRFEKAIDKALSLPPRPKNKTESDTSLSITNTFDKLYIDIKLSGRDGSYTKRIWLKEIMYIKSNGNFIEIYADAKQPYCPNETLSRFAEKLPTPYFMQCHRSNIVNRRFIEAWSSAEISLFNATKIPIGEKYKDDFLHWIKATPDSLK